MQQNVQGGYHLETHKVVHSDLPMCALARKEACMQIIHRSGRYTETGPFILQSLHSLTSLVEYLHKFAGPPQGATSGKFWALHMAVTLGAHAEGGTSYEWCLKIFTWLLRPQKSRQCYGICGLYTQAAALGQNWALRERQHLCLADRLWPLRRISTLIALPVQRLMKSSTCLRELLKRYLF